MTGITKRFAPFWSDSPEKAGMLGAGKEKSDGFLHVLHKKEIVQFHQTARFKVVPAIGFEPMTLRV